MARSWGFRIKQKVNLLRYRKSLRAKVALGVALPVFLALAISSLTHYQREKRLIEDQIQLSAIQMGEVALGSLRHAMLLNDTAMLSQVVADLGQQQNVQQVQIVDLQGQVRVSSNPATSDQVRSLEAPECAICHQYPPGNRPHTVHLPTEAGLLRITTPIPNEPACQTCHTEGNAHLGVLLMDVSLLDIENHLRGDIRFDLLILSLSTGLITLGVFALIHWLVVRRVEGYQEPLVRFAKGDFDARLQVPPSLGDELDELASMLNRMADDLEQHQREREARNRLRERAIIEERERIARELHDGLAQLLGYVNTKAMAVRLLLKNRRLSAADSQLAQLEGAARKLYTETREAILGLKMSGQANGEVSDIIQEYVTQFSKLSGLQVELDITPQIDQHLNLPPETGLQLFRILQEALTNVRKHAHADQVWVRLALVDDTLELSVRDNGVGFRPGNTEREGQPHFGLKIMRERAEAIDATLSVESQLSHGTQVILRLEVKPHEQHACVGG